MNRDSQRSADAMLMFLASAFILAVPASATATPWRAELQTPSTSAVPTVHADLAPAAQSSESSYVIGTADLLAINVWKEADLTTSLPVRADGKISLPLIGEVQAAGRTPVELEAEISQRLRKFIAAPRVTVMVQQVNSRKFNIIGEVQKPGSYPLSSTATIMDAIALAGGFRDFAKKSGVYVLRKSPDGSQQRLAFNYKEFVKGINVDKNIRLEPNDTVVIP